mmetsp:Transcript_81552/g.136519  ORF Transcript_81552/g.136519 Transcript_81552/m.136519 type:complete len:220 (+) Transcript_81552:31-690(+)|eukprot:CAMPEP_0174333530 /NCGR_PEP_ID=MMETSP0810-20121108/19232_1 /TAXON_ID=73025 ORGANISM="Eutreptiella gymnastica-like, Strain CCMP1594" /NCGR_SAMPLE_ID=MMETSP0810 /ASSEMBLY_ACC=CAM_ASM_000659 /LENGTH=219 /DNA_ID=CAMNT_0015450715 /DNA_START=27 /DNA_END=686 /DNA_ORIENTATION=+
MSMLQPIPPLHQKKIGGEELEHQLKRLYENPRDKMRKRLEELKVMSEQSAQCLTTKRPRWIPPVYESAADKEKWTRKLTSDQEQSFVERNYKLENDRRRTNLERSRLRVDEHAGLNTPKKQLTAEQCENMVHRLGTQALTQKETTLHNATIKHIGRPREDVRLNREQQAAFVERLCNVQEMAAKREKLEEEHLFVPTPSKKLPMAELSSIVERLATKSG